MVSGFQPVERRIHIISTNNKIDLYDNFVLFLKVIVYVNSNVYLLYHLQGGTDVLCSLLLFPVQAAFAPWCMCASLGSDPLPLSALVHFWFDALRT